MSKITKITYRYLPARPINPEDDSFHGSKYLLDIEWWYFDAVFDNGLSIHVGFRIYHVKGRGILQSRINLYKDGVIIKEKIKVYLLSDIIIDNKFPNFIINDTKKISFHINNDNNINRWSYNINEIIDDISVNLSFTGLTEGWKIETDSTCWTVPLPNAEVTGKISFDGKSETVTGKGYHDHNWGYSPTTVLQNNGWYWGRISSNLLHITWANTIESEEKQDLIAVVNKSYKANEEKPFFISIHPDNIDFKVSNLKKINKSIIPHNFNLSFQQNKEDDNKKIIGDLTMDTIDIHYDRIFIINYWRYHVNVNGTIQYGDITEKLVNKPQIIEYLQF